MECYVPNMRLGALMPPQTALEDKLGGLPWGFPPERWPICRECREPLSHLAQFRHSLPRLNLGREGRVLTLFKCEQIAGCYNWEPDGGGNAVIILEAAEMGEGLTLPPTPDTQVLAECRVLGYTRRQERTAQADPLAPRPGPKLGGLPSWVQDPYDPGAPYVFAAQLADGCEFSGPPPHADRVGCRVITCRGELIQEPRPECDRTGQPGVPEEIYVFSRRSWGCQVANFADGTAYLFVNPDPVSPSGKFLWQCT